MRVHTCTKMLSGNTFFDVAKLLTVKLANLCLDHAYLLYANWGPTELMSWGYSLFPLSYGDILPEVNYSSQLSEAFRCGV